MNLEITEQEQDLLLDLIEKAEEAAIQSMDHADSRKFRNVLRRRLELLAAVKKKVRDYSARAA